MHGAVVGMSRNAMHVKGDDLQHHARPQTALTSSQAHGQAATQDARLRLTIVGETACVELITI